MPCFFVGIPYHNGMQKKTGKQNTLQESLLIISLGRHTRLGDVLEHALQGIKFSTIDAAELTQEGLQQKRILFAASADQYGTNEPMRLLVKRMNAGELRLEGCVCAMIADGEQGGPIHLDAIKLLFAANAAGSEVIYRPLLESGSDMRILPDDGRGTPFQRYQSLARLLVERLMNSNANMANQRHVRFISALDEGETNDWRTAIGRMADSAGVILSDDANTEETIFLCENRSGVPDDKTLGLLSGGGKIRFVIASPTGGSDLYTAALIERACIRGDYALFAGEVTVFEGLSAVELLANKADLEKIKRSLQF